MDKHEAMKERLDGLTIPECMKAGDHELLRIRDWYPDVFKRPSGDIEVLPGWMGLIENSIEALQYLMDLEQLGVVRIDQIKEKMGGLRIYVSFGEGSHPVAKELVAALMQSHCVASRHICVYCGQHGRTHNYENYVLTTCGRHDAERRS